LIQFDSQFEKMTVPNDAVLECHMTYRQLSLRELQVARSNGFKLSASSSKENWSYLTTHAVTRADMKDRIHKLQTALEPLPLRVKVEMILFDTKRGDNLDQF
jgi:hypothetical protein